MAEGDIVERKVESGSVREVRHDHGIWVMETRWMKRGTERSKAYQVSLYAHGAR